MESIIAEGKDALEKNEEGASFEAGLVGAALRTEHYEIAGYEACISMASALQLFELASYSNLSHTYRSWLDETGAPMKVQQELMRTPRYKRQ